MSATNYDYGKCQVCGEQMIERQIKQDFWIKGDLIVIENIPAGVCPQCGEKIVRDDVGRQIGDALKVWKARRARSTMSGKLPACRGLTNAAFFFSIRRLIKQRQAGSLSDIFPRKMAKVIG